MMLRRRFRQFNEAEQFVYTRGTCTGCRTHRRRSGRKLIMRLLRAALRQSQDCSRDNQQKYLLNENSVIIKIYHIILTI